MRPIEFRNGLTEIEGTQSHDYILQYKYQSTQTLMKSIMSIALESAGAGIKEKVAFGARRKPL